MRRIGHGPGTPRPDGEVRQSQLITTFGPGAMVDLLEDAVLVSGLDFWRFGGGSRPIPEPRLRDELAERLRAQGRTLSLDTPFVAPPFSDGGEIHPNRGIPVLEFPRWFVCQNPDCRALVRCDHLERVSGRYLHDCETRPQRRSPCVPVRFVAACKAGHLDEFDWKYFVHEGRKERCLSPALRLDEGATGDFAEVEVKCTACGAFRRLIEAMVPEANHRCSGRRPWLGPDGDEECEERVRLLVRTASNGYFSQVVSALSIPERGDDLTSAVKSCWDVLVAATPETLSAFRQIPKVRAALAGHDDSAVLEAIAAVKSGRPTPRLPLRTAEYQQLTAAPQERPGELPAPDDRFFAREVTPRGGLPAGLRRLVLAGKLREVLVEVGFSRIESITPNLQGEYDLGVGSQPLGLTTDWLPATEILGEGIFLELDEDAVRSWEERPPVVARARELLAGYEAWRQGREGAPEFPGVRYYLLHSLSHLLMTALSLECGYAASALRERIYCAPSGPGAMAGLLISTGSPGAEGTLGGLVEEGRRIREHLRVAYDLGRLCSNDPVCAQHSPRGTLVERYLEGAACHGCLFVAENSCERFNHYLDRALVVPTLRDPDAAFFRERP
jgi:hypothetical protein